MDFKIHGPRDKLYTYLKFAYLQRLGQSSYDNRKDNQKLK